MRKLQGFFTKLPTSLPHNKFKQSRIFDRLRGLSDLSLSFNDTKNIFKHAIGYTYWPF